MTAPFIREMNPRPQLLRPIVLIGPSGAGKTTLGALLARQLNLDFHDNDAEIAAIAGRSIPEIFDEEGETGFRLLEHRTISDLLTRSGPRVIAAGAGLTTHRQARALLRLHAHVLWVDVKPEVAVQRLHAQAAGNAQARRPLLGRDPEKWTERYRSLESTRQGARQELADFVLDTSALTIEAAAEKLHAAASAGKIQVRPDLRALERAGVHVVSSSWQAHVRDYMPAGPLFAIVDAGCPAACAEAGRHFSAERIITLPGGEGIKHLGQIEEIAERLLGQGITRDGTLVAFGGGALLDCAGFLAATLFRGIRWVAVPTTLLAMVDATLGGKTAVNLSHGKNLLGAFHRPAEIWVWPGWLQTLSPRAFAAGAAEMCKHAFLMGDAEPGGELHAKDRGLFALARGVLDDDVCETLTRSLALKASVVEADPIEGGLRKILNLGHTLGHVFERESLRAAAEEGGSKNKPALLHGEAVAHGLMAMLQLSEDLAGLDAGIAETCRTHLAEIPTPQRPSVTEPAWLQGLRADKKRRRDGVDLILLSAPGNPCCIRVEVDGLVRYAAQRFP